jgi:hypothetical protein
MRRWSIACALSIVNACGETQESRAATRFVGRVAVAPMAAPRRPELVGDPTTAEREIVAVGEPEISDEVLLGLPGSHGLPVGAGQGRAAIPGGGTSVGAPEAGSLEGGIQLPFDPGAYTRRDATRSYATSQTLRTIQAAFAALRDERGVQAEVVIGDISRPRGGSFAPHVSHTSGRDIDIRLVLAAGLDRTTLPFAPEQVDWDATWALVHSFLETGHVTYVFLDFDNQAHLHAAALRAGVHRRVLDRWFQWPGATLETTIIRHEPGHRAHLHIRLSCEGQGPRCTGA